MCKNIELILDFSDENFKNPENRLDTNVNFQLLNLKFHSLSSSSAFHKISYGLFTIFPSPRSGH